MRANRWNVFVGICVLLLLFVILEEALSANKLTARITESDQKKAIEISEHFLQDELSGIQQYKVFTPKTGKYFYPEGIRKKVIEVTFSFGDESITTLVDVSSEKVLQVSRTKEYDWMKTK